MRTTLNLDEKALTEALRLSPGKSKTEVINESLREYGRRKRLNGLLQFQGAMSWEGALDDLRGRVSED